MAFSDRVPDALARALAARGFREPTPVQRAVLDVEPATRDMLVSAETGSGKTIAFGLALAARLIDPDGRARVSDAPLAAVITPTRELARQVHGELVWLFAATGLRIVCCTGGADLHAERRRLAAGVEVVVGSPGRLRDHVERGALVAGEVECVVLDEADDMLDLGFRDDLEFLLRAAAPGRRTLMFSATITPRIEALAGRFQTDAARIVAASGHGGADIRFEAVAVASDEREGAVVNLLRYHEAQGALVFCARRETVGELAGRLGGRGFRVVALSGAMPQKERDAAIAAMRAGQARVCVATDLAARGLDLPAVELVIHADLPASAAALTHRSGRTGRAGRAGRAVLVVPHPLRRRADALIGRAGVAVDWVPAPGPAAVRARDEERVLAGADLGGAPADDERAAAARLLARHDAESLAVALLRRIARDRPTPAPLRGDGEGARTARRMQGAAWFTLDAAQDGPFALRLLLPLICGIGGVARRDIGRIVVRGRDVRFEIAAAAAEGFAAAVTQASGGGVRIRRAAAPGPGTPGVGGDAGGPRRS